MLYLTDELSGKEGLEQFISLIYTIAFLVRLEALRKRIIYALSVQ